MKASSAPSGCRIIGWYYKKIRRIQIHLGAADRRQASKSRPDASAERWQVDGSLIDLDCAVKDIHDSIGCAYPRRYDVTFNTVIIIIYI